MLLGVVYVVALVVFESSVDVVVLDYEDVVATVGLRCLFLPIRVVLGVWCVGAVALVVAGVFTSE